MRIFHISDLHIGKHLHLYNLAEDQKYILGQITDKAKEYHPDVIVIAGDIYDKSVPSGEAYQIFDEFLNDLSQIQPAIPVLVIAGNHDNPQRLQYAAGFMQKHQIYISAQPPQTKAEMLKKIVLTDQYGDVNFYLFPFIKPGYVRHLFGEGEVTDYQSAYSKMIEREPIDYDKRNVLVAHQFFVSGANKPQICDSEQMNICVGGLDAIDTHIVENFDYVALGHIHGKQSIGQAHIRYSGTPLKYSVSEEKHNKSITMITLKEKGQELVMEEIPLVAKHDVRRIKGSLADIIETAIKESTEEAEHHRNEDYVSITLTDEKEAYRPKDMLEEYYTHILEVMVDNTRTRAVHKALENDYTEQKTITPLEAFREFYQLMQQQPMSEEEEKVVAEILKGEM